MIQLIALKFPICGLGKIVLVELVRDLGVFSLGVIGVISTFEIQLLEQNVILVKVSIVAPFGPPLGIDDVPLQLIKRTLYDESLRKHILVILE